MGNNERLIAKSELLSMVPYTIQHIYRLEKKGKFPKRVHVGENRVAWLQSEISAWMNEKLSSRMV